MKSAFGIVHKSEDSKKAVQYGGLGLGVAGASGAIASRDIADTIRDYRKSKLPTKKEIQRKAAKARDKSLAYHTVADVAGDVKRENFFPAKTARAFVVDSKGETRPPLSPKKRKRATKLVSEGAKYEAKYHEKGNAIALRALNRQKSRALQMKKIKSLTTQKVALASLGVAGAGLAASEVARQSRRKPRPQPIEKRGSWWSGPDT
jgi:hypothetical protein